ncbi:MAG: serine/threonine-protein kinase [Myxococcota bacterium]
MSWSSLPHPRSVGGKYEVLRVVGRGGFGAVYEAEHMLTKRRVALKLVSGTVIRASKRRLENRLFQEAEAAASIRHPGVVDVLDAGREDDGSVYVTFELLYGEDLETCLVRGGLQPADLVRVGVKLLDTLSAVHRCGFIHRDIKPANVFLARNAYGSLQVKLLDFGIANRMDPHTFRTRPERGSVIGTVEYMSPEQASGAALDARSDVWSVAAVLFRALAGHPPFARKHRNDTLLAAATEAPPSLATVRGDLPLDLISVIDRGLEQHASRRWPSAEDMAQALALCDHPQLHAVPSPSPHIRRILQRERLEPSPVVEGTQDAAFSAETVRYAVQPFDDAAVVKDPTVKVRRRLRTPGEAAV